VNVDPDSVTIGDALARHYTAHGLPADGGESESWFRVRIGPLTVRLPNPPARRRAVFFHDVNHILTGYNTVFSDGEMVIAGFEIGNGCGRFGVAWFINLVMMAFGTVVRPAATYAAYVRGRGCSSIYHRHEDRAALRSQTVADLRKVLSFDRSATTGNPGDRAHFLAWAVIAWAVTIGMGAAALLASWGIILGVRAAIDAIR
jgi:hypothetical protein